MKSQKLAYQAVPDRFRNNVKALVNAALRPTGLEVGSILKQRIEAERLQTLQEQGHWHNPRYSAGLQLDRATALEFLTETCLPYRGDYGRLPITANGDLSQYFLQNSWFESVDAEVLYSVVRRFQPANVVEVGSGFSTRLMRRAITDGKLRTKITSIDPMPNTSIQPYADEYIRAPVEQLEIERLVKLLSPGDLLFIDSSHRVVTGGDVPFLFLELLPRLSPGVLVHIHDIFIPLDYPVEWIMDGWGWNEQYLVHAFLAYNENFKILWPARYMWEVEREAVVNAIPNAAEMIPSTTAMGRYPSSFWLMKVS